MSSQLPEARVGILSNATDEPLYFPYAIPRLAGWLYWTPPERSTDVGLVICKPFGYEALCAHRSLRAFGQRAAASGVPTLSFDYSGTGDSVDLDPGAEQIDAWSRDIVAAIAELRRCSGVKRVCVLGFRLGAMLATLAASLTPIDAILVVAPVTSGPAYLRELQAAHLMALRRANARHHLDPNSTVSSDASIEVNGYAMSAATVSRLRQLDLTALGMPPVSEWLIIDRTGIPAARVWSESLSAAGARLEYVTLPGFVDMMMIGPQYTRIPEAMINRVCAWLLRFGTPATPVPMRPTSAPRAASLRPQPLSGDEPTSAFALIERPVRFGPDARLFGIVTDAHRPPMQGRAVLLVNAGADSHVCVGRLYVSLARLWARSGFTVLRMDLAGLGDSVAHPGRPDNEVYPPMAVDDIRAAVEFLRDRHEASDVKLAGLCSGAFHALRAAVAGVAVNGILVVNPQTFFWHQGMSLEDIQSAEVVNAPSVYRQRARSLNHWVRLLSGRVDVGHIAQVIVQRAVMSLASSLRDLLRLLRIRLHDDLGSELERLTARGVQVTLVFSRGEPGLELLKLQAGATVKTLRERCAIHIIEGADHTFSDRKARAALSAVLSRALFGQEHPAVDEYLASLSADQTL